MRMIAPYLFPYACFKCRRSFKRRPVAEELPCPNCGGTAIVLSRKFKAPRASARKQWEKVKYLVDHGFPFESVYHDGQPVRYPKTLAEAKEFVERYGSARDKRDSSPAKHGGS